MEFFKLIQEGQHLRTQYSFPLSDLDHDLDHLNLKSCVSNKPWLIVTGKVELLGRGKAPHVFTDILYVAFYIKTNYSLIPSCQWTLRVLISRYKWTHYTKFSLFTVRAGLKLDDTLCSIFCEHPS